MTREEQDEKEFEEWWSKFNLDTLYTSKGEGKEWCRQAFLASRRLMREKRVEKGKLLGDNEDREWMHMHNIK